MQSTEKKESGKVRQQGFLGPDDCERNIKVKGTKSINRDIEVQDLFSSTGARTGEKGKQQRG